MKSEIKMVGFDYMDASIIQEINRNISVLISTPAGTCAGDRNYGISGSFIRLPLPVAENLLAIELIEKVPLYEPRAEVSGVSCTTDGQGQLVAAVTISPNTDFNEEDGAENGEE